MLTLKLLREKPEFVIERLQVKHFDAKEIVYEILDIDRQRRAAQTELDACLAQQKAKAAEIGGLMKQGLRDAADAAKAAVAELKEKSKALEEKMAEAEKKQQSLVVLLPLFSPRTIPISPCPASPSSSCPA